jgi:hypothetical protein
MNDSLRFHRRLAARILQAAGVAAIAVPVAHPLGCGGTVVVDGEPEGQGGQGGASSSQSSASSSSQGPMSSSGAFTSSTSDGSSSASGSTGSGPPPLPGVQCFTWSANKECPTTGEAANYMISCVPETNYQYPTAIGGPYQDDGGSCCYDVVWDDCGKVGRPFSSGGAARTADARTSARPWGTGEASSTAAPRRGRLSIEERAALAEAWTKDALFEHASIASFARFALELMAVGAPAELVDAAHAAARDEVRHAGLCFALASAYRGSPVAPGPLDFGGSVAIASDLAAIAAATVREGCIDETIAAMIAAEQRDRAADPAVRAALEVIAEDESRHAELAWRTVAWALEVGGAEVRAAVERAFIEGARAVDVLPVEPTGPALADHGRLGAERTRVARITALDAVVRPCWEALLARRVPVPAGDPEMLGAVVQELAPAGR